MRYWDGIREEGSFRGEGNSSPRGPRHTEGEGRANVMVRVDTQEGMDALAKEYGMRIRTILCDNPDVRIPGELECTIIRDRSRWEILMHDRHYTLVQESEIRKTWFVFTKHND